MWYLIESIPDLCTLTYFETNISPVINVKTSLPDIVVVILQLSTIVQVIYFKAVGRYYFDQWQLSCFHLCKVKFTFLQCRTFFQIHNINKHLTERAHYIWLVMIKMHFLLLNNLNDINCGHVRKCVMLSIIFWTIYL